MWILCNNNGKSGLSWRVRRYGLRTFLCIFWDSSAIHHNRRLVMNLIVTPDIYYYVLPHAAGKYRSYYDKSTKSCGPLPLQDHARKDTTSQTKSCFSTLNFDALRHVSYKRSKQLRCSSRCSSFPFLFHPSYFRSFLWFIRFLSQIRRWRRYWPSL